MHRAPDLIFHNGRVRTMDPDGRIVAAVAVAGDRVVGLGADASVLATRGPRTRVVDLRGRTLLPGFTDAHVHPLGGGLKEIECALDRFDGAESLVRAVGEYAAANPDLDWIVGDGWSLDAFPGGIPRREALDAVVPDRPVFLYNRDGHGAWVNTRALELAGITAQTPDPPNGRIERDPDGTPLGTLQEAATELVFDRIPPYPQPVLEQALLDGQAQLHRWGITGWQDANVDVPLLRAYRGIAARGLLTARVVASLAAFHLDDFGGLDGLAATRDAVAADAAAADPGHPGPGRLAASTVKFFVDGILENFTGAMLDPYLDADGRPTGGTGRLSFEPARLRELTVELDRRRFQLHFHAIGDRATREALDAVEGVIRANGPRDRRPHIAHIQVIHPADIPRFAALDVVANAQPLWAVHEAQMDTLTIPFLGPERATWQYPFGSLLRAGAPMAFGSDWTVSTADPFPQLEVAVNRRWPGSDHEVFLPDERLTLDEGLRAGTVGSARVSWQDDAGWLGDGRLADLVVLDRDLDDRGTGPISDARVVATFVGGATVFESPGFELG